MAPDGVTIDLVGLMCAAIERQIERHVERGDPEPE